MLAYVDNGIVGCRMHSVYRNILRGNYKHAMHVLKDTVKLFDHAKVTNEIDDKIVRSVRTKLYAAFILMAARQYEKVHDYIRDVNYMVYKV